MKREYGVQVLGKQSKTNNLTGLGLRAPDCFMQSLPLLVKMNQNLQVCHFYFQEQEAVKEGGNNETKIDVVTLEEDKVTDSKETTSTEAREITASLQIQGEPEQENSAEMGDKNVDNADRVALEVTEKVDEVAIPVEDEIKTEKEGGEEGEDNPEITKGRDGKPVAVETIVTNETETGKDYLKYEELDDELPWAMYRSLDTPPQRPPIEEDEDWPASDNDEDYGNVLCKFQ